MIALNASDASVWVAAIAAVASIITAVLALHNRRALNTGNGITAGRGIAKLEDQMEHHENRLDRIEVRLVENFGQLREDLAAARDERQRIRFEQERHLSTYRHDRRMVDE